MARRRRKSIIPGFSWKRAVGITSAKRKIARYTGIPTTKSGRRTKMRRLTGFGCLVEVAVFALLIAAVLVIVF